MTPRILIAEPSKTLAALVKLSLSELGAELEVAHDGASALASARARLPDALVCEEAMPGLDGYGLAFSVRQLAGEMGKGAVPTLLLVSEHAAPDLERLAYVGIGDVLPKPFERAILLERVKALFDPPRPAARAFATPAYGAPAPEPAAPLTRAFGQPITRPSAADGLAALQAVPTIAPPPPTSPFLRPTLEPRPPDITAGELKALVGAEITDQIQAELEPLLAAKLPHLLDAAVQRLLPGLVQAQLERAVAEQVPALAQAAVQRTLAEVATPTAIQRIVSEDAKVVVGEVAQRIEGRLEHELLERLDRFARDVLPGRLQAQAEQIIWKIVPTIAEDIVKDEIKRLTQELP